MQNPTKGRCVELGVLSNIGMQIGVGDSILTQAVKGKESL